MRYGWEVASIAAATTAWHGTLTFRLAWLVNCIIVLVLGLLVFIDARRERDLRLRLECERLPEPAGVLLAARAHFTDGPAFRGHILPRDAGGRITTPSPRAFCATALDPAASPSALWLGRRTAPPRSVANARKSAANGPMIAAAGCRDRVGPAGGRVSARRHPAPAGRVSPLSAGERVGDGG